MFGPFWPARRCVLHNKDRGYDLLASKDEKNVAMGTPGRMTKDQVTSKKKRIADTVVGADGSFVGSTQLFSLLTVPGPACTAFR